MDPPIHPQPRLLLVVTNVKDVTNVIKESTACGAREPHERVAL